MRIDCALRHYYKLDNNKLSSNQVFNLPNDWDCMRIQTHNIENTMPHYSPICSPKVLTGRVFTRNTAWMVVSRHL